jgi:acyl-[acyl-carrier-protein]-phospholipid O-acyltransferase / long-chain-fatty-acid--[acyl-carrier-protein] ligase
VIPRFLRILLRVLFRVRVEGDATPLSSARTLIVANQDSLLDGLLLNLFLPGDVTIAVTPVDLRNPLVRLPCFHRASRPPPAA